MTVRDRTNAPHYRWGADCDGWRLLDEAPLSVIEERMPPGASERTHRHERAQQLFYVLSGRLTIEADGRIFRADACQAIAVAPGRTHQVRNESADADAVFLVISGPSTRGDREDL